DAAPPLDGARHGLYRFGGGAPRSADQYDLRAALSCRRLSRGRRQREPRHRALPAGLLLPSQGAGLLALQLRDDRLQHGLAASIPNLVRPELVATDLARPNLVVGSELGRRAWVEATAGIIAFDCNWARQLRKIFRGVSAPLSSRFLLRRYSAATALTSIKNSSRTKRSMIRSVLGG